MTISSSTSFEFDITTICKMAYREAGLLNPNMNMSAAEAGAAIDELQRMVMGSQAKGLFAKVVKFELVPLQATVSTYTMPQSTLDVVGDGMFVPAAGTNAGESRVALMQRAEYQAITNKETQARPNRYFPQRTGELVQVIFWPIPSTLEAGASVRLQTHRIRANVREGTATLDYEQYWVDYMATELAYRLAKAGGMPPDVRADLFRDAEKKYLEVKPMAMQRGSQQFTHSHPTGWGSR